jgi:hypothetical protein
MGQLPPVTQLVQPARNGPQYAGLSFKLYTTQVVKFQNMLDDLHAGYYKRTNAKFGYLWTDLAV